MLNESYTGYFDAKNWSKTVSVESFWYYDGVRQKFPIFSGSKVLEIGFGDGRFLDWCKARKCVPVGVEILDECVRKARALGHEVYEGYFSRNTLEEDRRFDVVVLFDVAEHMTSTQLSSLFSDTLPFLNAKGRYLLRIPNGNSPFAGPNFFGDITHLKLFNSGSIAQIVRPLGLRVSDEFNDQFLPSKFFPRLKRRFTYLIRALIQITIGYAYFGKNIPLDPNVFIVVQRVAS